MVDFSPGLGYLPVLWAVITSFNFIVCYSMAVSFGHIYPFVPAISDTGAQPPESSIFSEFMNLSAFVAVANLSLRYLQLISVTKGAGESTASVLRLNNLSMIFGFSTAFGATLIGNFPSIQSDTTVIIHDIGAVLLFGGGAVYCWMQSIMTFRLQPYGVSTLTMTKLRFMLSGFLTFFGLVFFIAEIFAYQDFLKGNNGHTVATWSPGDKGYSVHVFSNVSEWIAGFCLFLFGLTYFEEFQAVNLKVYCVRKDGNPSPILSENEPMTNYSSLDGTEQRTALDPEP